MLVKLSFLAPLLMAILVTTSCSTKLTKNKVLMNQDQANDARQLIREAVDSKIVPGFVAQIYQDNQLVFSDTYGFSSLDRNIALHHNDLFRIYSMTKPVTVVAALILLEQGKLKLDDEVSRYKGPTWYPHTLQGSHSTLGTGQMVLGDHVLRGKEHGAVLETCYGRDAK